MPAYYRSDLSPDLFAAIKRAIEALHKDRPGPALGLLDSLLNGPHLLELLELPERRTLARRVCSTCKRSLGYALWAEDKAHPDESYTETGAMCGDCFVRAEREIDARCAAMENAA